MGIFDKLQDIVAENADEISKATNAAIDKVSDAADGMTGNKRSEQIEKVTEKAKEHFDDALLQQVVGEKTDEPQSQGLCSNMGWGSTALTGPQPIRWQF